MDGIKMNGVLWALLGTCFTFSVTTLGAGNVFLVKNKMSNDIQCAFLGFAGGVMIAASIWSLLLPAIARAEEQGQISWIPTTGGFVLGVGTLLFVDCCFKYYEEKKRKKRELSSLKKQTKMMILAITIHNIPEGMAVGLAFALAAQNPENTSLFTGAIALAIGIGIQNYPEGTAIALPLIQEGMSKRRAFFYGSMSAIVEPIFGVLAAVVASTIIPAMSLFLAFAAGTMIYVVVEELIPQAHMGEKDNVGTLGFVVGFLIMMILDTSLG